MTEPTFSDRSWMNQSTLPGGYTNWASAPPGNPPPQAFPKDSNGINLPPPPTYGNPNVTAPEPQNAPIVTQTTQPWRTPVVRTQNQGTNCFQNCRGNSRRRNNWIGLFIVIQK